MISGEGVGEVGDEEEKEGREVVEEEEEEEEEEWEGETSSSFKVEEVMGMATVCCVSLYFLLVVLVV